MLNPGFSTNAIQWALKSGSTLGTIDLQVPMSLQLRLWTVRSLTGVASASIGQPLMEQQSTMVSHCDKKKIIH